MTAEQIKKALFTFTPLADIKQTWEVLYPALQAQQLADREMLTYILATIYVENDKFKPLAERPSKWSTKGGQPPYDFSHYVGKGGNKTIEEASLYRGSGLIQLTLKNNYMYYDSALGLKGRLVREGYVAGNEPLIASKVLAQFIKDREPEIRKAIAERDFKKMRKIVNGPAMLHWEKFKEAFLKLEKSL